MNPQKTQYIVATPEFLLRNIRAAMTFELGLRPDDGSSARKITERIMSAPGVSLGTDAWLTEDKPLNSVEVYGKNQHIIELGQENAALRAEIRTLKDRLENACDEFNLLAKDAVDMVSDAALTHAEKRGAIKWWHRRVWQHVYSIRNFFPSSNSLDSEIPF